MLNETDLHAILADPVRRSVLEHLATAPGASASDLAEPFDISKPALSRHLKILEDSGLVERQVDRQFRRFSLSSAAQELDWLKALRIQVTAPMSHLDQLEAESIHIMREVVAEMANPVMMYSIGKDSSVMLHLALKAFYPSKLPFPLLHIDTRWKFREMIEFRDATAKRFDLDLRVFTSSEGLEQQINPFDHGAHYTDVMKTAALKQALDHYGFDVAFGGARRDEEKSRAKERVLSFRSKGHVWNPKGQRPEIWNVFNTRVNKGETIRAFPLSNWTELDIWQYIVRENIPIVPLYYAAERPVVERDGSLIMVDDERLPLAAGESPQQRWVRFRTLGCYPLTGAMESRADSLDAIVREMQIARTSERQGRLIDKDQNASMEQKKLEGYF